MRVTMQLTDDDVANAEEIRASLGTKNKAHAVSIAMSLTAFVCARIKRGDELMLHSPSGDLSRVVMDELRPKQSSPSSYLLSKRELEALKEIGSHQSGGGLSRVAPFYWRQSSMTKLHARGYVEPMPGYEMYVRPGWRITDAGRKHLSGFPKP